MHPTEPTNVTRERYAYDVVIVGAGVAGLSAAIRLKQRDPALTVVVVEKGSTVGAHILSGAVIDPVGLDQLLPDWRTDAARPAMTPVREDALLLATGASMVRLPSFIVPPMLSNHGAFIVSLSDVAAYLAQHAESLGVEIYAGFAAASLVWTDKGAIAGVVTDDKGVGRDGVRTARFAPGVELVGKYTLLAEGARGSLARQAIDRFGLDRGRDAQKFGLGLKEVWRIDPAKFKAGRVQHTFGWPLGNRTGGGSFLYHYGDNLVSLGFVVHLNYENPTLSPFDEFQRFKTHPRMRALLAGGERLSFGARVITEGGWQSVPKLTFPGGALVGCAAGFVNVPRIKGSHNAILSGLMAAERVVEAIAAGRSHDEIHAIETQWRDSAIGKDLKRVRNVKPLWSSFGTLGGIVLGGLDMWCQQLFGRSCFGTLSHRRSDRDTLKPLSEVTPIAYPRPDGVVSFDRSSSIFLSSVHHDEDQPAHLRLADPAVPTQRNWVTYGEPARLYCPAGVYEVTDTDGTSGPRFVINAQNCIHCKTCDIKDPANNITWTVPEGGGGPNYASM